MIHIDVNMLFKTKQKLKYNISSSKQKIYFSTWRDFYAYRGYISNESVEFKRELFGTKFDIPLLYMASANKKQTFWSDIRTTKFKIKEISQHV